MMEGPVNRSLNPVHLLVYLVNIFEISRAACPTLDKELLRSGLTCPEKEQILELHNRLRQIIAVGQIGQPPARNMIEMTWDDELASKAQALADTCRYGHDGASQRAVGRFRVGQNIGMTWITLEQRAEPNFASRIYAWFEEVKKYKFGNPFSPVTGHYTQMVWQDTSHIGCGYSYYLEGQRYTKVYVCNYGPTGNIIGYDPYESGQFACDAKGLAFSRKYYGLCERIDSTPWICS
ncbi:salivary antigen-5 isoform X1 [Bemisia tabaci]|uniref:salivary antigen-5 isoform X1 n=1 Tax=Bemisia tabaci TaxID=7038 RepID=UPI003B27D3CC